MPSILKVRRFSSELNFASSRDSRAARSALVTMYASNRAGDRFRLLWLHTRVLRVKGRLRSVQCLLHVAILPPRRWNAASGEWANDAGRRGGSAGNKRFPEGDASRVFTALRAAEGANRRFVMPSLRGTTLNEGRSEGDSPSNWAFESALGSAAWDYSMEVPNPAHRDADRQGTSAFAPLMWVEWGLRSPKRGRDALEPTFVRSFSPA